MIKDIKLWEQFEDKLLSELVPDYEENLRKFLYMLEIHKSVETDMHKDPLDGIEVKINLAKLLNKSL